MLLSVFIDVVLSSIGKMTVLYGIFAYLTEQVIKNNMSMIFSNVY